MSALLLALFLQAAPAQTPTTTFQMMDGVVVDIERDELYMMSPSGSITAVSMNNGKIRWISEDAGKPLAKHGSLLISQIDTSGGVKKALRLVALDTTKKGRPSLTCDPIELPRWAPDGIDQPLGGQLTVDVRTAPDVIYVVWSASTQWVGKGPPPPDILQRGTNRHATGIVRCDLVSGSLMGAGRDVPPPQPPARMPQVDTDSAFTRVSSDRKHYLQGIALSNEVGIDRFMWTVYDAKSESVFAEVPGAPPVGSFLIYADSIIFNSAEPTYGIRALHPATGTILWEHSLRPTWYTGPTPE